MDNKGQLKMPGMIWLIAGMVLVLVIGIPGGLYVAKEMNLGVGGTPIVNLNVTGGNNNGGGGIPVSQECSSTLYTAVGAQALNALSTTATQYLNYTLYVLQDGVIKTALSDTTTPATYNANCGHNIELVGVSADHSRASFDLPLGRVTGPQDTVITGVGGMQKAKAVIGLLGKVFDEQANAYKQERVANSTTYVALNSTFGTTTSGIAAEAIGTAGTGEWTIYVKANSASAQWGDVDTYVGIDVGTTGSTVWETPIVKWEDQTLSETSEAVPRRVVSDGVDYYYKLPEASKDITDVAKRLYISMKAQAGQDPTADIKIYFYASGRYLSTDGTTINTGVTKDDTSYTYVHQPEVITLDLS